MTQTRLGAIAAFAWGLDRDIRLGMRSIAEILVVLGFFITRSALPAWVMLGYWLFIQFASGLTTVNAEGGGVAFWAHVGGFAAGLPLALILRRSRRVDYRTRNYPGF